MENPREWKGRERKEIVGGGEGKKEGGEWRVESRDESERKKES